MHQMSKRLRRRSIVAGLAAIVLLTMAAVANTASTAGPPPTPANLKAVLSQVNGLKPAARDAKLAQLAAQEGQVNVYTSMSKLVTGPMQKAWEAAYPKVKLNLFRGASEDVTAKVLAEASANKSGADVVETNGSTMLIFQHKKNILIPYRKSPFFSTIPKAYRFDTFTGDRLEEFVVAWNTNLVKDPPKSFQELATSKWAGKLSIEPTDVDWFAQLYNYFTQLAPKKMTPAAATKMFDSICRNSQLTNGHTTQATLLAAGQFSVVVSGHAQSLEQLQAQHAPIAFGPPFVSPVVERPQGVGLPYRLAHPAAALLFDDWLLSAKGGQPILLKNGVQPANPHFQDNAFASHPVTTKMDLRPIVEHWQAWNAKYNSCTRLGKS